MEEIKTTQAIQHDKSKVMTVPQFMKEYQMGHNKAYEIIHAKGFPCIFMGRKCLIIRSLVDEWFEKHIGERF